MTRAKWWPVPPNYHETVFGHVMVIQKDGKAETCFGDGLREGVHFSPDLVFLLHGGSIGWEEQATQWLRQSAETPLDFWKSCHSSFPFK